MSTPIKSFRDLIVWQKAFALVADVYRLTQSFSDSERFGLTSQLRRAAVSIPSNIAEGHARASRKEYANFLSIALGSTAEVETQLLIAETLGYLTSEMTTKCIAELHDIRHIILAIRKKLIA